MFWFWNKYLNMYQHFIRVYRCKSRPPAPPIPGRCTLVIVLSSYSIDLLFFSAANTIPVLAETMKCKSKIWKDKFLDQLILVTLVERLSRWICFILTLTVSSEWCTNLHLIPIEGAPAATAAIAYSICTSLPEGLKIFCYIYPCSMPGERWTRKFTRIRFPYFHRILSKSSRK